LETPQSIRGTEECLQIKLGQAYGLIGKSILLAYDRVNLPDGTNRRASDEHGSHASGLEGSVLCGLVSNVCDTQPRKKDLHNAL